MKLNVTLFTLEKTRHLEKNETFQGVEFTEISCGRGEFGWSRLDGTASRCNALRATVSCPNDGRKFGSLESNMTERTIN